MIPQVPGEKEGRNVLGAHCTHYCTLLCATVHSLSLTRPPRGGGDGGGPGARYMHAFLLLHGGGGRVAALVFSKSLGCSH